MRRRLSALLLLAGLLSACHQTNPAKVLVYTPETTESPPTAEPTLPVPLLELAESLCEIRRGESLRFVRQDVAWEIGSSDLSTELLSDLQTNDHTGDGTPTLLYRLTPAEAEPIFSSSDNTIVRVDADGTLRALAVGTATISVTSSWDSSLRSDLTVRVLEKEVLSLDFADSEIGISFMESLEIPFQVVPEDIPASSLLWSSSQPGIVMVDANGNVCGGAKGIAEITATDESGHRRASLTVTVTGGPPPPLSEIPPAKYVWNPEDGSYRYDGDAYTGAEIHRATVMLTGDLMCLSAQQAAVSRGGTYDFRGSFRYVKNIFAQSDLAIGNLETMVSSKRATSLSMKTFDDGSPNCNAPVSYLDAVRYAGYDAVVTANNHSFDTGVEGLIETMFHLDRYGLIHTGSYAEPDLPAYQVLEVKGIRVGLLSYTMPVNRGIGADYSYMMQRYSRDTMRKDMEALRGERVDFVICYIHWGTENTHQVTGTQRTVAQDLADAGVDVIAGSHPHCLQPAEWITAADGREVLCLYSMGNFVSSMTRDINNDTVIVSIEIEKSDAGVNLTTAGYYPCKVYVGYGGNHHVIIPVSPQYNEGANVSGLSSAQSRIQNVIGDALPCLDIQE